MKYLVILLLLLTPSLLFGQEASIIRIVDGDTVVALVNNKEEKIRIIGINTPESVDPRRPVECFGKEASNQAQELLTSQKVQLEDATQRDTYGRLLAYITLADETDFGLEMIETGYAYSFKSYPHARLSQYNQAEKRAQENNVGLWSPDACLEISRTKDILKKGRDEFIQSIFEILQALLRLFS